MCVLYIFSFKYISCDIKNQNDMKMMKLRRSHPSRSSATWSSCAS